MYIYIYTYTYVYNVIEIEIVCKGAADHERDDEQAARHGRAGETRKPAGQKHVYQSS